MEVEELHNIGPSALVRIVDRKNVRRSWRRRQKTIMICWNHARGGGARVIRVVQDRNEDHLGGGIAGEHLDAIEGKRTETVEGLRVGNKLPGGHVIGIRPHPEL